MFGKPAKKEYSKTQSVLVFLRREVGIKNYKAKICLALVNSIFLLLVTIALQYTSYIRADEATFLKFTSILRFKILNFERKPYLDKVVFIDVSKDLELTDEGSYGGIDSSLRGAQEVITDRFKLAKLFRVLNRYSNQYKFVLCDILFEKPGPGDSVLKIEIEKMQRIIATSILIDKITIKPIYNIPSAPVNYSAINQQLFAKIPVFYNDSVKSLPIYLYENLSNNHFTKRRGIVMLNGKPTFNTIIPNFYYQADNLIMQTEKGSVNTYYLGELLMDQNCFDVLRNKLIIIGNFSGDLHSSFSGKIPGPLILLNSFLTLYEQGITIKPLWLIELFIIYFLISYWMFIHPEGKLKTIHEKIKIPFISKFIIKYISFIGILILVNILSYFSFGAFIGLFYIATYLTLLQIFLENKQIWRRKIMVFYVKFFGR